MDTNWSDEAKLMIERRSVLMPALEAFFADWSGMLRDVHVFFSQRHSIARIVGDPAEFFQFFQLRRSRWPEPWGAVHYEVLCNIEFLRRGIVGLSLRIEGDTPKQADVCARIRSLLPPYESQLHSLLAKYSPKFPKLPVQDILNAQLPLGQATPKAICEAVEAMMQTETFVDEALFAGHGETIWRTDFFADRPRPRLRWGSEEKTGGQTFQSKHGRLGGPALRIDGTKEGNYDLTGKKQPDDYDPAGKGAVNIMRLARAGECKISNGDQLYLSCVVKTTEGGRLWLDGQGQPVCALLDVPGPPNWIPLDVPRQPDWQHVSIPMAPVCRHSAYDFAQKGAHVFLISQTRDPNFLFSSIEIGRQSKGA